MQHEEAIVERSWPHPPRDPGRGWEGRAVNQPRVTTWAPQAPPGVVDN